MSDNTNPIEFWNVAHENADTQSLSGHSLDTHLDTLRIRELLPKCKTVLCIGIGDGSWIRDMFNQFTWLTVECIDVSTKAFDSVPMLRCFTSEDFYAIDQINRYDLIISFWVSPHMTDPQLSKQLFYTIKALTTKGVLALQYNEPINPDDKELEQFINANTITNEAMSAGLLCRTPEHIHSMVELAGGRILYKIKNGLVDGDKENEMVAHIVRSVS